MVILHYTGMVTAAAALTRLCSAHSKVSAHYTVDEEGNIYRHVAEHRRAWHAGISGWRNLRDINSHSMGIELVNPGYELGYRRFSEPQMDALETLLPPILERYCITADGVLGHSDVACTRKRDPGHLFDWQRLAARGIGVWPHPCAVDDPWTQDDEEVAGLLSSYGYDLELAACLPVVIAAFQRHFYPQCISGQADEETIRRLRALVRCYRLPKETNTHD